MCSHAYACISMFVWYVDSDKRSNLTMEHEGLGSVEESGFRVKWS